MPDKEQAKEELKKLLERYHKQESEITNEQQLCDSLIRPFFNRVLGWDTENPSEFKTQYSQRGKRMDYITFLKPGISQFIIEVKALNHDIISNHQDYQQALNYARYKERDFAILTNFKHFIILRADIEKEPLQSEIRSPIDVENEADFDILWNFNKEVWSTEKGEKLYALKPGKRRLPVTKLLVDDMKKWRVLLLRNLRTTKQTEKFDFENELILIEGDVQKFLGRLVFICHCEDAQLQDGQLRSVLEAKENENSGKQGYLLKEIRNLFSKYRDKYDSDLFMDFGYTDRFVFEDSLLAEIIRDLRKPSQRLPYDFAAIDTDVLGKAYENFLGHIITGKKRYKEKEAKSKRKEEGIYYTPQYIVNYIVDNTVRAYINEMKINSFEQLLNVKVLDPACGSGTFLIRAFEVLEEEARRIKKVKELEYSDKIKLVLNCIYGVDKDERAADTAKLRLSLKLAATQRLPELSNNIKIGDSLIDDEETAKGKAFKWGEGFKEIMNSGGFDIVIGNPPYGAEFNEKEKNFLIENFSTNQGELESFKLFFEKGLKLLKSNGKLGFIVPNTWLYIERSKQLRRFLLTNTKLLQIVELAKYVFEDAPDMVPAIIIFEKENSIQTLNINECEVKAIPLKGKEKDFLNNNWRLDSHVKQKVWLDNLNMALNLNLSDKVLALLKKIEAETIPLSKLAIVKYGIKTGNNNKYVSQVKKTETYKKCLFGRDIGRYSINWKNYYLNYGKWLNGYRNDNVEVQKILIQYTRKLSLLRRIVAALDTNGEYYPLNSLSYVYTASKVSNFVLIGILNSKLMNFYFSNRFIDIGIKPVYLVNLPIKAEVQNSTELQKLVKEILELDIRLHSKKLPDYEHNNLLKKITLIEDEINNLVYEAYGITKKEEKQLIEDSLK